MMTDSLGFYEPFGVNGVLPGGGRCAACHCLDVPEGYLLCKPCWNRLPRPQQDDLTYLWDTIQSRHWNLGEVRDIQSRALNTIEHVSAIFDPHLPHESQDPDDVAVFRRIRALRR